MTTFDSKIPWLLPKFQISLIAFKIPWIFPDLEVFSFFPDQGKEPCLTRILDPDTGPQIRVCNYKLFFLFLNKKHMLLVLKKTVSMRWFFWAPKIHV